MLTNLGYKIKKMKVWWAYDNSSTLFLDIINLRYIELKHLT